MVLFRYVCPEIYFEFKKKKKKEKRLKEDLQVSWITYNQEG